MKVINFNDFKIIQENINSDINVGDYVLLVSGPAVWVNLYGIVKDTGRFSYSNINYDNLRLVSFLCELSMGQKIFISGQRSNNKDVITSHNITPEKHDLWVHEDYLMKFESESQIYKYVEDMKIKDSANKYNL